MRFQWGVTAALMTTEWQDPIGTKPAVGIRFVKAAARHLPQNKPAFGRTTGTGKNSLPAFRKVEFGRLLCCSVAHIGKQRAGLSKEFRSMLQKQQRGITKEAAITHQRYTTQHFAESRVINAGINAIARRNLACLAGRKAPLDPRLIHGPLAYTRWDSLCSWRCLLPRPNRHLNAWVQVGRASRKAHYPPSVRSPGRWPPTCSTLACAAALSGSASASA